MNSSSDPAPADVEMRRNGRPLMASELKEFVSLVRTGKLFAVQDWLKTKEYIFANEWRKSPLLVAVESGFHSMVEVLLTAGVTQQEKDTALEHAVYAHRMDLVTLLVTNGAQPSTISFFDILYSGHPFIIRLFEERGADMISGTPIFNALKRCNRYALSLCKRYISTAPGIQEQADMALRYHAEKGNAKWVSLMLWAGANPRSAPEGETSALEIAVRHGSNDVLKPLLRLIQGSDLNQLIVPACLSGRIHLIKDFLARGADPNTEVADSNCLSLLLGWLGWRVKRDACSKEAFGLLECINVLLSAGAKWDASTATAVEIRSVRQAFYGLPERQGLALIQRLHDSGALGATFTALCCCKGLQDHFRHLLGRRLVVEPTLHLIFPPSAFKKKRRR